MDYQLTVVKLFESYNEAIDEGMKSPDGFKIEYVGKDKEKKLLFKKINKMVANLPSLTSKN